MLGYCGWLSYEMVGLIGNNGCPEKIKLLIEAEFLQVSASIPGFISDNAKSYS